MIGCKLSVRDVKTWFLRLLGISPARLLYIGGGAVAARGICGRHRPVAQSGCGGGCGRP